MIFDTTFIIDLMERDEKAVIKLHDCIRKSESQFITSITVFELFSGLARCNRPKEEKEKILKTLTGQIVLNLDNDCAEKAGEIDGSLIKDGKMISVTDSMIAGIALVKKEKVLTRNVKDFSKINGLYVETY